MKTIKLFFMMLCVMASTLGFSNVGNPNKIPLPIKTTIKITGEIGKYDFDCKKISLQCLDFEFGIEIVGERTSATSGSIIATLVMEKTGELQFTFSLPNEPFEEFFNVNKNTALPQNLCRVFGFSSMIIPKGEYPNKKNSNGTITATFKVLSK